MMESKLAKELERASQREADSKRRYKQFKSRTIEETQERQWIIATVVSAVALLLSFGAMLFAILY